MERYRPGVRAILVDVVGIDPDDLDDDLDLVDEGLIDSMLSLQIVNALERRFDVRIPDEDLEEYVSVNAIAAGIAELRTAPDHHVPAPAAGAPCRADR
jgi:acyl carrier protein